MVSTAQPCPLCQSNSSHHARDAKCLYLACPTCALVFVPRSFHLSDSDEKKRYDHHQNDAGSPHYRVFLQQLIDPLLTHIQPGQHGLDFGCGPGPALSRMLEDAGMVMTVFDKYYANDPSVFDAQYDFITASEVLEHLADPMTELTRLWRCLKPGGILALMTEIIPTDREFLQWRYKDDATHVCFFDRRTMAWLVDRLGGTLEYDSDRVFLLSHQISKITMK